MAVKKNRIIWIIALVVALAAAAAGCFWLCRGCSDEAYEGVEPEVPGEVHLISNGHPNPLSDSLLCLNSTLLVTFGPDTAYVVIDSLAMGYANGRYYLLQGDDCTAEPEHYALTLYRKSVKIDFEGGSVELELEDSDIEAILDGQCHSVSMKSGDEVTVSVNDYVVPEFHEYADRRLREEVFGVRVVRDLTYGQATGYWTSMAGNEGEGFKAMLADWMKKDHHLTQQQLTLDLYLPQDSIQRSHPLILFLHGGAFLFGDKGDSAISKWCYHFAQLGYVTASMNYRMGFSISKEGLERTGYMAVQDAHAAMRYLIATDSAGMINRDQLFVAGSSAGSITALNLAFMTNKTRPSSSFKLDKKTPDLGNIESSGNSYKADFKIRGIANMWGAMTDLGMMDQNREVAIISFHGDQDKIVPYDKGYPFSEISRFLGGRLFGLMYGSASIHRYAQKHGMRSRMNTFEGYSHSPHVGDDNAIIPANFNRIQQETQRFFYETLVPVEPEIFPTRSCRHYALNIDGCRAEWQARGGIILSHTDKVEVVWLADEPEHQLRASLTHPSGLQYTLSYPIEH